MSWENGNLWAKAVVYFERAFDANDKGDDVFGFSLTLALEFLLRSSVAFVSPVLLAEPDRDQRNILHALGKTKDDSTKKSINITQVIKLCENLFGDNFKENHGKICLALINRRNEEIHTGTSAFETYPSSKWLVDFYHVCKILSEVQGKTLESLFGDDIASDAEELLQEERSKIKEIVNAKVKSFNQVFEQKDPDEKEVIRKTVQEQVAKLSWQRHHKVTCPACTSDAVVRGNEYGPKKATATEDMVEVRTSVSPREFECFACGLKLTGYGELEVVGLGGRYTRTEHYSPEDYYGLPDFDDIAETQYEYDNE